MRFAFSTSLRKKPQISPISDGRMSFWSFVQKQKSSDNLEVELRIMWPEIGVFVSVVFVTTEGRTCLCSITHPDANFATMYIYIYKLFIIIIIIMTDKLEEDRLFEMDSNLNPFMRRPEKMISA